MIGGEYLARVRAVIKDYGWMVQGVGASGPGISQAQFSYTVGLTPDHGYEMIMYGLPTALNHELLNTMAFRVRGGGELQAGDEILDLVEDYPVLVIGVVDNSPLTVARLLYGASVAAFQLVFPDKYGVYPWDPESTLFGLPILGVPPE